MVLMDFWLACSWQWIVCFTVVCFADAHSCNDARNVAAPVGSNVTFTCCTNHTSPVGWRYRPQVNSAPYDVVEEEGYIVNERYDGRVTAIENRYAGIYSMTIHGISTNDSGQYTCEERGNDGEMHVKFVNVLTAYHPNETDSPVTDVTTIVSAIVKNETDSSVTDVTTIVSAIVKSENESPTSNRFLIAGVVVVVVVAIVIIAVVFILRRTSSTRGAGIDVEKDKGRKSSVSAGNALDNQPSSIKAVTRKHRYLERLLVFIEPDYGLPRSLHSREVISTSQMEQIVNDSSFYNRIEKLLNILCDKLDDRFHDTAVHKALTETRQSHLSNFILHAGNYEDYIRYSRILGEGCDDNWPLTDQQQRLLSHVAVSDGLNLWDGLIDELVHVDCISQEQRASLLKDVTYDRFFQILRRRSLADYKAFFGCVKSKQRQKIIDIFTNAGAYALIKSTVRDLAEEDADTVEADVIKLFRDNAKIRGCEDNVRDRANSLLNAIGLDISFIEHAHSIHWSFNCTSVDALERLRRAYDSGDLQFCLEDVVTRLSGRPPKVHLDVTWSFEDYCDCDQYLRTNPIGGVFAPSLIDNMPCEITEIILIRTAIALFKRGNCPHNRSLSEDDLSISHLLSHDNDICAVQTVNEVCFKWWNILTGSSRNRRIIRRRFNEIGRVTGKIWQCRKDLKNKIEMKFGLLTELAKRRFLTPAQHETIVSAIAEDFNVSREIDFGEELETVNESTKQLLLQSEELPFPMYRQFKKALSSCHQEHLVNAINSNFKYDQLKHGTCWPINKDVLERIVVHYRDLIDLIDTRRGVVDDMLAVDCISQSHAQYIKSASNNELQNRRLLEVLCRRSQSDFDAALTCLCNNKQNLICPLLQQTAVVAKLTATGAVLEEDEHQIWLLTDSADERYSSHTSQLARQMGKDLHLIAVKQKIDQWIFYILCQSVEAVLILAAFSARSGSISLLSDVVTNAIGSKTVELQSLNWPVVDYNRCLHVFYTSEGLYSSIYDLYYSSGHQLRVGDQTVEKCRGNAFSSQTMDQCSDHLLELVLPKAAIVMFKWLKTLTTKADFGAIYVMRTVCRRWSKALNDRQCVRRHMNGICQPYRRRMLQETLKNLKPYSCGAILNNRLFIFTALERKAQVYDMLSSPPFLVQREIYISGDVSDSFFSINDVVSCDVTSRLYISDFDQGRVWLVDCSTLSGSLKAVKFVEISSWVVRPPTLSTTSQQLLVTSPDNKSLELYDVDGKLLRSVNLTANSNIDRIRHAVQTTRDTFYVCSSTRQQRSVLGEEPSGVVLEVDVEGHVLRYFDGAQQLNGVCHYMQLADNGDVFVQVDDQGGVDDDWGRSRVLQLNSELKFERVLATVRGRAGSIVYCYKTGWLIRFPRFSSSRSIQAFRIK